jgi:microcompartment protein CcmK/EutM
MQMARVVGTVVATQKDPKLVGLKLQLVQPLDILTRLNSGRPLVAVDTVGAGTGDVVMIVGGSSARQTDQTASSPVDLAIVSIIDLVEVEGNTIYDRRQEEQEQTR